MTQIKKIRKQKIPLLNTTRGSKRRGRYTINYNGKTNSRKNCTIICTHCAKKKSLSLEVPIIENTNPLGHKSYTYQALQPSSAFNIEPSLGNEKLHGKSLDYLE